MLSVVYQYFFDIVLVIEGCSTYNIDNIKWDDSCLPAVRLSRALSHVRRHDKSCTPENSGYINMEDMLSKRPNALTPGKCLASKRPDFGKMSFAC